MFDPTVGRWSTQDPEGFLAGDADLYRLVGNSPTNATDPTGLAELTPKSVGEGPQTGLFPVKEPRFNTYWGVGLYLDKAGLAELNKAGGGYIIEKRTIEWNFEGDYLPPRPNDKKGYPSDKKGSVTAWFLDPISFSGGNLNASNDFSNGKGGAHIMDDNSIAVAYFSIINAAPIPFTKGKITVTVDYQLYSGNPDDIIKTFPQVPRKPEMPSGLGADENIHKPWLKEDPDVSAKPLINGKQIKATMTWNSMSQPPTMSFDSPNTDIGPGPQRKQDKESGHGLAPFPAWKYHVTEKKWIREEAKGDQNP